MKCQIIELGNRQIIERKNNSNSVILNLMVNGCVLAQTRTAIRGLGNLGSIQLNYENIQENTKFGGE
jgi:hypothetical protein